MEILDIVDERGRPTGQTIEREKAHQEGILHRTSHVWILRHRKGRIQILLQKRSECKDSFPGCYDISSAGHIPAGVDFKPSALRELKEELGYEAQENDLIDCGIRRFHFHDVFHGQAFFDNQVSRVYILWLDLEADQFVLQKEEVSEVKWFDFEECVKMVEKNLFQHCIYMEELEMVKKKIYEI